MINHTLDIFGQVDILVNNAGIASPPVPLHAVDDEDWDRVLDVTLRGVFLGMKYVLPQMMEQNGGAIINMASIAGVVGAPNLGPYAAAKAGIIELTRVAAAEYSRYNIRCNALAPGWTKTRMVEEYINGDEKVEAGMLRAIPMRRFGEPEEIAHAALFLAADDAAFLQGQTIVLDGGLTII
jgi:NAD(P)-dependent dehydrogenase (short-subunit alcohol dehydrogenase family)